MEFVSAGLGEAHEVMPVRISCNKPGQFGISFFEGKDGEIVVNWYNGAPVDENWKAKFNSEQEKELAVDRWKRRLYRGRQFLPGATILAAGPCSEDYYHSDEIAEKWAPTAREKIEAGHEEPPKWSTLKTLLTEEPDVMLIVKVPLLRVSITKPEDEPWKYDFVRRKRIAEVPPELAGILEMDDTVRAIDVTGNTPTVIDTRGNSADDSSVFHSSSKVDLWLRRADLRESARKAIVVPRGVEDPQPLPVVPQVKKLSPLRSDEIVTLTRKESSGSWGLILVPQRRNRRLMFALSGNEKLSNNIGGSQLLAVAAEKDAVIASGAMPSSDLKEFLTSTTEKTVYAKVQHRQLQVTLSGKKGDWGLEFDPETGVITKSPGTLSNLMMPGDVVVSAAMGKADGKSSIGAVAQALKAGKVDKLTLTVKRQPLIERRHKFIDSNTRMEHRRQIRIAEKEMGKTVTTDGGAPAMKKERAMKRGPAKQTPLDVEQELELGIRTLEWKNPSPINDKDVSISLNMSPIPAGGWPIVFGNGTHTVEEVKGPWANIDFTHTKLRQMVEAGKTDSVSALLKRCTLYEAEAIQVNTGTKKKAGEPALDAIFRRGASVRCLLRTALKRGR